MGTAYLAKIHTKITKTEKDTAKYLALLKCSVLSSNINLCKIFLPFESEILIQSYARYS